MSTPAAKTRKHNARCGSRRNVIRAAADQGVPARDGGLMHVKIDPEQEQRPQYDGQDDREKRFRTLDVREIVVRSGDDQPDYQVDDAAEPEPHPRP